MPLLLPPAITMLLLLANMLLLCGWLDTCLLSPCHPAPAGQRNDWEEGSTALGHHLIDFWTNICLCQSLIIEKNPEGPDSLPHVYQVRCCCREGRYRHGKHDFTLGLIQPGFKPPSSSGCPAGALS